MKESGFLEIFVDNQAQTPVYYDNLRVSHSATPVMEVNAYYPYGKLLKGLSIENTYAPNMLKYNAKELITAMELDWLDYGARVLFTYDIPILPTPDRFAEKYYHLSPYSYAAGNPINIVDINGDYIVIVIGEKQISVYEMNEAENESEDEESFHRKTVRALNTLASKPYGKDMISAMQNSEFGFYISYGEGKNNATPNNEGKDVDGIYMSGANILWSDNEMITLGHEMSHGWDIMSGYDTSMDLMDAQFLIPEGEVRAVHMENLLRTEQGMDLRYQYNDSPAALVNSKGRENLYNKYNYNNNKNSHIPWNYGYGTKTYGTRKINPNKQSMQHQEYKPKSSQPPLKRP